MVDKAERRWVGVRKCLKSRIKMRPQVLPPTKKSAGESDGRGVQSERAIG